MEIQSLQSKSKIVSVKYDEQTQFVEEITLHNIYLPPNGKFYDWTELFQFQQLKKLNFELNCQWISLPDIPDGTWSVLEKINVYLYTYHGYENMIGLETEQLKKLLPHVRITEEIDGPFYY